MNLYKKLGFIEYKRKPVPQKKAYKIGINNFVSLKYIKWKCYNKIWDSLLGKTYSEDYPNNKQRINRGEQEQFLMKDVHEPIIESEIFEKVQTEMKRRSNFEIVNGEAKRIAHYSI